MKEKPDEVVRKEDAPPMEEEDSKSNLNGGGEKEDNTSEMDASADSESKATSETAASLENQAEEEKDGDTDLEKESPEQETSQLESNDIQHDTEMVSEDDLSSEGAKAPLETEEVSDEEFLLSIMEDLETEAVSDDELPPLGKRKKNGRSQDSNESDKEVPATKKGKLDKDRSTSKDRKEETEKTLQKKSDHQVAKSKTLSELEKYWKVVNNDPTDFTGWTYLLQYVDQESDVEEARKAYDSFLALYPYCYGYWRKYADYEKRKGDKTKSEEVFLRGLKAIPLSVELWLHYLNFCKQYKDNEEHIRSEFNRAIDICGLEFRSDRLWDCYIKWETEGKRLQNALLIYEKLLSTPTHGYKGNFDNFEDFVRSNQPNKMLSTDEFLKLRLEVLQKLRAKPRGKEIDVPPPGDDEGDSEQPSPVHADEETTLIRERIIFGRVKLYKATIKAVHDRWSYEEGIKRPYFHVKELEKSQLDNWHEYLDFEISQGDEQRTIILFERCLIACAQYQEFWVKFIKYLKNRSSDMSDKIREVYQRACLIHHPKKSNLLLSWAAWEEDLGNTDEARKIMRRLEENVPNMGLMNQLRRINLERRAGHLDEAANLYEKYLADTENITSFIPLSIKFSRFCWKILNDIQRGLQVLRNALEKEPNNPRVYTQLLEISLSRQPFDEEECLKVYNDAIVNENMSLETRRVFAQKKLDFLEDFGSSIKSIHAAQAELNDITNHYDSKREFSRDERKSRSKTRQRDERSKDSDGKKKGEASKIKAASSSSAEERVMRSAERAKQDERHRSRARESSSTSRTGTERGKQDENSRRKGKEVSSATRTGLERTKEDETARKKGKETSLNSRTGADREKQDELLKVKGKEIPSTINSRGSNFYSSSSNYGRHYNSNSYDGSNSHYGPGGQPGSFQQQPFNQYGPGAGSYQQQPFNQYNQPDAGYPATGYQNWGYNQPTGYGNFNQNWTGNNYY